MALASVTYVATPGQTVFPVPFHLPRADTLTVTVDGTPALVTTDWTPDSGNLNITFLVAMAGGEEVVLTRDTPRTDAALPVTFTNGAAITKGNLDDQFHHLQHEIQELTDDLDNVTGDAGEDGEDGAPGMVWRGPWSSLTAYVPTDAVEFGGSSWIALTSNTNAQPDVSPADWDLVAQKGDDGADGADGVDGQGDELMAFMGW